ncbi:TetR/AcrR family transcriptional regulator [Mucilaginibacter agri]|uniref:TetR family transcriptional regulator n=1 Tax=Mucilaginibacter agri TaxID=2695265 RepID=A0A965ZGX1_9SPHI|nr:TetR/AcrR family transcriptional regulator [Mucilaginibacter agri]NCD70849.1 TetR family transcriptional regulator [Mucilaginibacter agri]
MAGRPKIFDEQEVINKAVEVFWNKGYEASSADELLAAMGIGKGSFYLSFKGGKKELFEKSLKQFADADLSAFRQKLAGSANPIQEIKDFFLGLLDAPAVRKAKGCYVGNGLMEMSTKDAHLKELTGRLLAGMEALFTETIRQAQQKGQLKTTEKPEVLGRYLLNLWNGINVTMRVHPGDDTLKDMIKLNLAVLT